MNLRFLQWFAHGHVADALCGSDAFFVEDATFRGEHDRVLAVGQLLEWAEDGNRQAASRGFEEAVARLIAEKQLRSVLRLLRAYSVLTTATGTTLTFDHAKVLASVANAVRAVGPEIARDESFRALVLAVGDDFPSLKPMLGLQ